MSKKLHLSPCKIRQFQAAEDGNYKRTHFFNWFLQAVHDHLEAGFQLSGYINAQNNRYWSGINRRQTLVCGVPLLLHK